VALNNITNKEKLKNKKMIQEEEEDIEDILKHKISWMGILKGSIVGLFTVTAYIIITYFPLWSILGIVLILLSVLLMLPQLPDRDSLRQTKSVLNCENKECGTRKVRDYEDGDFVFKTGGICPKCNSNFKITEIYSIKLKPEKQQKKEKKKKNL